LKKPYEAPEAYITDIELEDSLCCHKSGVSDSIPRLFVRNPDGSQAFE
jgi:hypothetical protein